MMVVKMELMTASLRYEVHWVCIYGRSKRRGWKSKEKAGGTWRSGYGLCNGGAGGSDDTISCHE